MLIDDAQAQLTVAMSSGDEQNSSRLVYGAEINTAASGRTKAEESLTIEAVIHKDNLRLAYQRVVENKGAAGVDNLSVSELKPWLTDYQKYTDSRQLPATGNPQSGHPKAKR